MGFLACPDGVVAQGGAVENGVDSLNDGLGPLCGN